MSVLHWRITIEAGYPLLVEKPLVFDLNEADQLLEARPNATSSPP